MSVPMKLQEQKQKQDLDYFRTLASVAAKGGNHNASPETLLNIMLTAKDLGISPMKAINGGFYIVNGKISMSTALMTDRIRREGHSIKIPEWTSQKCVIIGVRKDNGDSIKFEFTMEDAQAAGLSNSPTWKKFPKQMLYNRAMATLARTLFPDVVGNAYSEDEKWDIMNVPPEQRPLETFDDAMEIALEVPAIETIGADEITQLSPLIEKLDAESNKAFFEWIAKSFGAPTLQHIPKVAFEKCLNSLSSKIKYLNDKNKQQAEGIA